MGAKLAEVLGGVVRQVHSGDGNQLCVYERMPFRCTPASFSADAQLPEGHDGHCHGTHREAINEWPRHHGVVPDDCDAGTGVEDVARGHHQSRCGGGETSRGSVNMSPGSDFGSRTASPMVLGIGRMTMSVPWRKICTSRSAIWKSLGRRTTWELPDLNTVVRRIVALQSLVCTLGVYEFASRR